MKNNHNNIYTKYIGTITISLTSVTTLSAIVLSGITINNSYASTTATANASITVLDSCTTSATNHTYNISLAAGATDTISGTDLSINCNDYSGFDVYAVGYSGDSYDDTNTDMISSTNTAYNIKTNGTGNNSYWKMKLEEKNTTGQVTIPSAFTSFTNIPSDYTKVASRNSSTSTGGITITPSYQIHISTTQPAGSYTGKVKYTIVHPNGTAAPSTKTYMQDLDSTSIAALLPNIGNTAKVYDERDESEYLIGKLADENYWMLDNLRLDLTNSTIRDGLTPLNTNADNASLTSLLSGNRANGDQYAISGFVTWNSNNDSNAYNQAKANAAFKDRKVTSSGPGSGKIGVYYNYCAASAGSYCYDSGSSSGNALYDICPSGWHMPTGGPVSNYQALNSAYNGDASSILAALSLPLSGYFERNMSLWTDTYGLFWSSTRYNDDTMYYLRIFSTDATQYNYYRDYGYSVRCVAN